jgi:hypothetical protein
LLHASWYLLGASLSFLSSSAGSSSLDAFPGETLYHDRSSELYNTALDL